jgi:hypothetical protein
MMAVLRVREARCAGTRGNKRGFSEKLSEYSIAVEGWSYFYSYIAEPLTALEVSEFIHLETLELHGRLIQLTQRAQTSVTIRIACEKSPVGGEQTRYSRPVLGNLDAKKRLLEAYVLLPAAHVTRLTAIMASDRIKFVRLMTTNLVGRRALVRSIDVLTEPGQENRRADPIPRSSARDRAAK